MNPSTLPSTDEPLPELSLDNSSFDSSRIEKRDIEEIPGAFVLTNFFTEEECNKILNKIYNQGKSPADSVPVLFRGWSDNPEEEYRKLGTKKFYKSESFASLLFDRLKHFIPETVVTQRNNYSEQWKVYGLTSRHRFLHYGK